MSTNYYVHTQDGEEIHLGQYAAGGFTFRAYPERGVTDYASWRAQLDLGEIRTESGSHVTRTDMVTTAAQMRRVPSWAERGRQIANGFVDDDGRRWLTIEFC